MDYVIGVVLAILVSLGATFVGFDRSDTLRRGLAALGLSACAGKEKPKADLAASQVTTIGAWLARIVGGAA